MTRAGGIVLELAAAIVENRAWLSEIDGAIGDGDHGVNMAKGFSGPPRRCALIPAASPRVAPCWERRCWRGSAASMGPLYGVFFIALADASAGARVRSTVSAP